MIHIIFGLLGVIISNYIMLNTPNYNFRHRYPCEIMVKANRTRKILFLIANLMISISIIYFFIVQQQMLLEGKIIGIISGIFFLCFNLIRRIPNSKFDLHGFSVISFLICFNIALIYKKQLILSYIIVFIVLLLILIIACFKEQYKQKRIAVMVVRSYEIFIVIFICLY